MRWAKKKILVVLKAYPSPSQKHGETVCTAGITEDGEWIRLYPIPFRELDNSQKFKIFQWIEVEVKKSNEKLGRPESYKVNADTIKLGKHLPAGKGWLKREEILRPMISKSLEEILEDQKKYGTSLGAFKPKKVLSFEIRKGEKEWGEKASSIVKQRSLFSNKSPLEKIPYTFHYKFRCDDNRCSRTHDMTIVDWQLGESFRNFVKFYSSEEIALSKIHEKWFDYYFAKRESFFVVGTDSRFNKFMILSVVSPRRVEN